MCAEHDAPAAATSQAVELARFHHANIHERRFAARLARAMPILMLLMTAGLVALGIFWNVSLLLTLCAVLNLSMWLWVTTAATFGIMGSYSIKATADVTQVAFARTPADEMHEVTHLIVFPNYKEEEELLAETLASIAEAQGSERFCVVLAMEEREGPEARSKAASLESRFSSKFSKIFATYHPAEEVQVHLDGSADAEVPGKASNLKWAVQKAYEYCRDEDRINLDSVLVTVADADCLFHPSYFSYLTLEVLAMRQSPGEQHKWTMWQAPQLPYRNYYLSPAPSRVWGYISSMYEFGGVSSLSCAGHHMVFSAYSLHLQLAVDAELWDGDVIAEDHHAYLKCFFYSVRTAAAEALAAESAASSGGARTWSAGCRPALRVRPVMLPVKSTSVISPDGYWQTWIERWHQAKRHCQGVAELSYSFLATWDMLRALPLRLYNLHFVLHLIKVLAKPVFMHTLPICQTIALGVLTLYWLLNKRSVPQCPDRIWMASSDGATLLCGLAGAWALMWPVLIPFGLVAVANYRFLCSSFLEPREEIGPKSTGIGNSIWHMSDAGVEPTLGSKRLTMLGLILFDCGVLMGPMMVPYGLFAEVLGGFNVLIQGNHFKYVTAAKLTAGRQANYGTMKGTP